MSGAVTERERRGRHPSAKVTADPRGTIAQRLQYLVEHVTPPGQRPFGAAEIARWINESGSGKISSVFVSKILAGERQPSLDKLQLLAKFFGVSPSYFVDDDPAEPDTDALIAQIMQRNITLDAQQLLAKIAQLAPATQAALSDIVDNLLLAEGKAPPAR